ncbi:MULTISPECIES: N-acetylmuramoyl-L-alanine amidase [Paenibacillus]|uniref:N-acetylmuramoyl-L-alanine amidase n=2 Tax=Paenibacillus validus TaxID=44253 RepID=A0A7X3CQW6_9BACL|nr:N-acetylmuramoyl-L-alanine amidase [Paenibacillus validus]MUG69116.1 N-acetylmuramoyl-L-alanine amidase [Paenibacillus validus]
MAQRWLRAALVALCVWTLPGQASAATVVVDPGHGGYDPGAIGVNGLQEKVVNLDISRKLRDLLEQRGYDVRMSRDSDVYLSLSERVAFAKNQNADLFVSIHANSYSNPSTRGAMVLYYDDAYPQASYPASAEMRALTSESRELARKVLDSFVATVGGEDRGLVPSAVYVVRSGNIPSVLVETAFLSNSADAALLANDSARLTMAEGIAKGIEAYLPPNLTFPDTRGHWAREAIQRLADQAIVTGTGKRFEPARALTRAEWVTLLGRLFDLDAAAAENPACASGAAATVAQAVYDAGGCRSDATKKGAAAFRDVTAGHWAYAALDQAVKAGLLDGYPDGTLRPDNPVSRAEVAALFQRLAKPAPADSVRQPFRDVPGDYWAAEAIAALKASGFIDGVTATEFAPERAMNRAEAAALIDRYKNPK